MSDPKRHDKIPADDSLNPYRAPKSRPEPAADQIPDFASRKRRKLIQILFVTAIFGFLAGLLPEDSSINRVKELSRSSKGKNHSSIGPTGLVPVDKGLATKTKRTHEAAPRPTLRRWKPGLKTMAGPASETLATNPRSFQTWHPLA